MIRRYLAIVAVLLVLLAGVWATPSSAREDLVTSNPTAMLAAATTGSATIDNGIMPGCRESAIYIDWGAGTSAGAITVETAHASAYAGTWAPLTVVSWSAVSREDVVQITGVHGAIRTRISTTVTGGTVNTYAVCN